MKSRAIVPMTVATLTFLFAGSEAAHAQTPPPTQTQPQTLTQVQAQTPGAWNRKNLRFFQQFITDAAIVDRQWYGADFIIQRGAFPPFEDADAVVLRPTIAFAVLPRLEIGGSVPYTDFDLDDDLFIDNGTDRFSGESGLGDLTAWAKYAFMTGDVTFSAGAIFDLPTGSEDDGLGTGEVTPSGFAAFRTRAGDGVLMGEAGIRFNGDPTIVGFDLEGKNSVFLGGGFAWEPVRHLAVSVEVTVESERYEDASSDFRATGGVQWLGLEHHAFRGALGVGLSDAAPDYELIFGYSFSF